MKSASNRRAALASFRGWTLYDVAMNLAVLAALALYGLRLIEAMVDAMGQLRDFTINYAAAKALLLGQNFYDPAVLAVIAGGLKLPGRPPHLHHYPPLFAIAIAPLAALEYRVAEFIWAFVYLASFGLSIWLIIRGLDLKIPMKFAALAVLLVVSFPPFYNGFLEGQVGPVLLALIVGAWYLFRKSYRAWVGSLLAVASLMKLTPGLLLVYFLLRREWKVCTGAIATGLGLIAATLLLVSPARQLSYVLYILPTEKGAVAFHTNSSITGMLSRFFTENDYVEPVLVSPLLASVGILVLSALMLAVGARYCWGAPHNAISFDLQYSLVIVTILLVAPLTWIHHLVFLYLPLLVYLKWFLDAKPKPWGEIRLMLVSLLLLSLPATLDPTDRAAGLSVLKGLGWSWLQPYLSAERAPAWWALLLSGKFWGLVALYILNIALIRKSETKRSQAARLDGH